jgi:hypothetical protein
MTARPSLARRRRPNCLRSYVAAELAPTDVNARIAGHEVAFAWRLQRLVVEMDGFAYHANRVAFERDRLRDAELQAAG